MSIRHVVLSDLHLGARDSLLTHVHGSGEIADGPSEVLAAFANGMRETLRDQEKPQLVLLGDALDLGLSPFGDVSKSFLQLLDAFFPVDGIELFDREIIYVAGNHDHHLWRMAQDNGFLSALEAGQVPGDLDSVTKIFGTPTHRCRLMESLFAHRPHLQGASVKIAYPNWGLSNGETKRAVVMHHGHYLDGMYRALSNMRAFLGDGEARPDTMRQLEQENGPWIDFLWSDLGSAGEIGDEAGSLYEVMLSAGASHDFAESIARRITGGLHAKLGINPKMPLKYGVTLDNLIRAAVDLTAGRAAERQRDGYGHVLGEDEIEDLGWYLGTPLAHQVREEISDMPRELSFIFGHTHKPFQDELLVDGYDVPVGVFNTGGWVLDEPTLMPVQGCAAMLVSDELEVASLRLFNDPTDGKITPVRVEGSGRASRLVDEASAAVERAADHWANFSNVVHARIVEEADVRVRKILARSDAELREAAE
ncbi:metallophosphoesterase [Erythrobacter sp. F6033]|uniref:metallophosphoesterase n=1 Tax=Erythrobacter sp. F6033 TaxID=2926401 RepID=UPI001FF37AB4|nr:metallophosphoesterase [Erythrobacter sp. F6033]MCK0128656.1 metallophosphoesterase [Erythrobacter sp. F6033]